MNTVSLSSKEIVKNLLLRLPDNISLHQILQEIEFIAAVHQGIAELDCGENVTIEQIEKELPSWIIR
jgi:predicted transcriptional regulator